MLFIILITLCFLLLLFKYKTNNYNYWKNKNIIQVEDIMWKFLFGNRSMPEVCKTVYDEHDKQHIGTFQGTVPSLILKNVEDIQAVFAGDFQSFYRRGIKTNPNDILADNLLFTDDFRKWKLIRQKLSPVFTSSKLKNMFYIIEKCAHDFVVYVENNESLRTKPFNMLYSYTTSSIGASVFGIDTQVDKSTMDSPFSVMACKALAPTLQRNIKTFIASLFPKLFELLRLKIFGDHEKFFIGAVKSVLESRKYSNTKNHHDFIEICLELQNKGVMQDLSNGYELWPTDELIAAQAFFFFLAGVDTSANAMHFTLLELASNPKILERVHEEIDNVFEMKKEQISYTDIENLQYLEMVISEAMRKYPPIGFIQRLCSKDTVLPSGVKIEKDIAVVIPVLAIHRDEKYFPNPDEFDPERFHPSNESKINKFTYLPFGEGNRICIGTRFARMQVKAGLAWLLRRFTLSEQEYSPKRFEKSSFGLRDSEARYDLIPRKN